ncbi:hypothetical protein HR060_01735 [Catenovulum sp. SM1970]|uniref:hypothetical protein n=1 Tax=Marinifaba aquimaris TaxID=2741323 RepID=UPI00157494D2|nr:hypothetical protein [Marinifaba aquimaris]NTS75574.1 hypothetical protein [Marinifaba aquimaris]
MLKVTLTSLAILASGSALAAANGHLKELAVPVQIEQSQTVEVNGQTYQRIITQATGQEVADTIALFAGDQVAQGAFNQVSKATGTFFVAVTPNTDVKALAKDLGLTLVFTNGETAVLRASEDANLLQVSDVLRNDSRVDSVKIELSRNKNKPE